MTSRDCSPTSPSLSVFMAPSQPLTTLAHFGMSEIVWSAWRRGGAAPHWSRVFTALGRLMASVARTRPQPTRTYWRTATAREERSGVARLSPPGKRLRMEEKELPLFIGALVRRC